MGNGKDPGGGEGRAAARDSRRAAREAVFALLYETEFHPDEPAERVFARAAEERGFDPDEAYTRDAYFGVLSRLHELDDLISRHAKGWRTGRLSRVSRAVLRLGAYEIAFTDGRIPAAVAINEAVDLAKKYDDGRARAFVNGVLNAVKDDLAGREGGGTEGRDGR